MTGKKNVIITSSNARDGDFLADHWLASLAANTDLSETDVVVLDYGLSESQRRKLHNTPAQVVSCVSDGAIVAIRFRDMAKFLREHTYEQVLTCDGGDIIFQSDISGLFQSHPEAFRAVCEGYWVPFHETAVLKNTISAKALEDIPRYYSRGKKVVNAGLIVGPCGAFIELCEFTYANIADKSAFGPDQILITYFLYKRGFHELESKYNFVFYTADRSFSIRSGVFLDENGGVIPVVHNAGRFSFLRAVSNFGYGEDRNNVNLPRFYLVRGFVLGSNFFRRLLGKNAPAPTAP